MNKLLKLLLSSSLVLMFCGIENINAIQSSDCETDTYKAIEDNPDIIDTYVDDEYTIYVYSDGTKVKEKDEMYIVIVPEYATPFEAPHVSSRSVTFGTVMAVIGSALSACEIIEWTFGANPCEIAYKYLLKVLGSKARTGKYKVIGDYHRGYIPGCEPRNSLPCNSGYYTYQFIPS